MGWGLNRSSGWTGPQVSELLKNTWWNRDVFFDLWFCPLKGGRADDKTTEGCSLLVEEECSCQEDQVCTHTCCSVFLCWKGTWCSHEGCLLNLNHFQSPDLKDSPWSMEKSKEGSELRLEYREQAIDLMQELMRHKMFHRCVLKKCFGGNFPGQRKYLLLTRRRRRRIPTER